MSEEQHDKEIDEHIQNLTLQLVAELQDTKHFSLTEKEILFHIISFLKCEIKEAKMIFQRMIELGLELCKNDDMFNSITPVKFDLQKFAAMRGYTKQ